MSDVLIITQALVFGAERRNENAVMSGDKSEA